MPQFEEELPHANASVTETESKIHHPRTWSKDVALQNIKFMFVTLETSKSLMSLLNDVLCNMEDMLVTLETSQSLMAPLNAVALSNICPMFVTLETSHVLMTLLNDAEL